MDATAKLNAEIADLNDANKLTILLAKQCHCAELPCSINGNIFMTDHRNACERYLIDNRFDSCKLFGSYGLTMREIKAQVIRRDK